MNAPYRAHGGFVRGRAKDTLRGCGALQGAGCDPGRAPDPATSAIQLCCARGPGSEAAAETRHQGGDCSPFRTFADSLQCLVATGAPKKLAATGRFAGSGAVVLSAAFHAGFVKTPCLAADRSAGARPAVVVCSICARSTLTLPRCRAAFRRRGQDLNCDRRIVLSKPADRNAGRGTRGSSPAPQVANCSGRSLPP